MFVDGWDARFGDGKFNLVNHPRSSDTKFARGYYAADDFIHRNTPAQRRADVLSVVIDALDAEEPGATATGYAAAVIEALRDAFPDA